MKNGGRGISIAELSKEAVPRPLRSSCFASRGWVEYDHPRLHYAAPFRGSEPALLLRGFLLADAAGVGAVAVGILRRGFAAAGAREAAPFVFGGVALAID